MYAVAGHALEVVTGEDFATYMRQLVFQPIGMDDTHCSEENARKGEHGEIKLSEGYRWVDGPELDASGKFESTGHMDEAVVAGAGAMISNILDLAKWIKWMLGQSDALSSSIRDEVLRPRNIDKTAEFLDGSCSLYALGYDRGFYKGIEIISHNGTSDSQPPKTDSAS